MLYRGFLITKVAAFIQWRWQWPVAALLLTAFFAVRDVYQGPLGVLHAGTFGLMIAFVFLRSRNLCVPIVAHATYDISSSPVW